MSPAMEPDCIVLDEPTAMLDPRGREEVLSTITKLNRENGTVVGTLPEGWTAAYLNLEDDNGCVYSSEVFFN